MWLNFLCHKLNSSLRLKQNSTLASFKFKACLFYFNNELPYTKRIYNFTSSVFKYQCIVFYLAADQQKVRFDLILLI